MPHEVTPRQGELALIGAGLYDAVMAAVENLPAHQKVAFQRAQSWCRTDPTIAGMAAALGLTHEQVNELFRQAGGIA